mmetsp:Transcript_1274/g.1851  ORF Transcript_1274/g.1851 Transcript_1274/m.1851 type:complete len:157 (-) Transcript_1274:80-550(-)
MDNGNHNFPAGVNKDTSPASRTSLPSNTDGPSEVSTNPVTYDQVANYAMGYQLVTDVLSAAALQNQAGYNLGYGAGGYNAGAYVQPAYGVMPGYYYQQPSYNYAQLQTGYLQPFAQTALSANNMNNWAEYMLPDGRTYWYNASTGTSQWEKPPGLL